MAVSPVSRRIFLAHAREDKGQVRRLYDDLKAHGLDPWLDEVDLLPGQIWKVEIAKAIGAAGVFLACLSSRSVAKVGYVQREFRTALEEFSQRPQGSIYLIPIRLEDCEIPDLKVPVSGLSLRDIHWIDIWQEGGFAHLVQDIEHALDVDLPSLLRGRREDSRLSGRKRERSPQRFRPKHKPEGPKRPDIVAFMSYARLDDEAYNEKISDLRATLERLVGAALGRPFKIFQDIDGTAWGQNWKDRLDEALERSELLIPILSPYFFQQ